MTYGTSMTHKRAMVPMTHKRAMFWKRRRPDKTEQDITDHTSASHQLILFLSSATSLCFTTVSLTLHGSKHLSEIFPFSTKTLLLFSKQTSVICYLLGAQRLVDSSNTCDSHGHSHHRRAAGPEAGLLERQQGNRERRRGKERNYVNQSLAKMKT